MKIIVDTGSDIVDATDGVTSLREAIALAEATAGADEIVFDASVTRVTMQVAPNLGSGQTTSFAYSIGSADGLTINGDTDGDGASDVEIYGGRVSANGVYSITPHFEIAAGAALTLEALELAGGGIAYFSSAAKGGAATAGNKSPAGADGADAYGSILNEGTLTLDRVKISGTTAIAQDGGDGGQGANGGRGLDGFDGTDGALFVTARAGGDGGDGKDGSKGGNGGDGGDAATIINRGDITIIDSAFGTQLSAEGGDGGDGGKGGKAGNGGDGGQGGDSFTAVVFNTTAKEGGDGGNSGFRGNGGDAGDGGDAALRILNQGGTASYDGDLAVGATPGEATAGVSGAVGARGDLGSGGDGGLGGSQLTGGRASSGSNGTFFDFGLLGFESDDGAAAEGDIGVAVAPDTFEMLAYVRAVSDEVTEGDDIVFQFGKVIGAIDFPLSITYEVVFAGTTLDTSDFASGAPLSGTIVINSFDDGATITLPTLIDGVLEGVETVGIVITEARNDLTVQYSIGGRSAAVTRIVSDRASDLALDNDFTAMDGGDTLEGLAGDDTLRGSAAGDLLLGGGDDDSVTGAGGDDTIEGGDGDDFLAGGSEGDRITGGRGDDNVFGGAGDDMLIDRDGQAATVEGGPSGDDLYVGGAGNDSLVYAAARSAFSIRRVGDDLVLAEAGGSDTVQASVETIIFRSASGDEQVDVAALLDALAPAGTGGGNQGGAGPTNGDDTLTGTSGPDRMSALGGDDVMNGLAGRDLMIGGGGSDVMRGAAGADTLKGGAAADRLLGGGGNDRLEGGRGVDTISGASGDDTGLGGAGNDRILGGGGSDRLIGGGGADRIAGGRGGDIGLGGAGNDIIKGNGGSDRLIGAGGGDRLFGDGGADRLFGGGGDDRLVGGGGDDRLDGGRGDDFLRGGAGRDVFDFSRGDGEDRIADFRQGADRIKIGAGANDFGDLTITQRGGDAVIRFANVTIIADDENAAAFDAGDFIF